MLSLRKRSIGSFRHTDGLTWSSGPSPELVRTQGAEPVRSPKIIAYRICDGHRGEHHACAQTP